MRIICKVKDLPCSENLTAFGILMFFEEKHLSSFYYGA